jgi:hypothetical protein
MSTRRSIAIVCIALAAAIAVALGASDLARSAGWWKQTGPAGVVADCATRSGADFPAAFTSPRNLVVGPLVLIGAAGTPAFVPTFGGQKFPLLVSAGHRVTLELSTRTRKVAGLAYGPLPQGYVHLRNTHRVVTFIACPRGEPSGASADGRAVTFWSGGVLASSARCVPLQIWIDAAPSPRRVVIRLGVQRCA